MKTPLKIGIVASITELGCVLFVHSSHREAVAVVSGQSAGSAFAPYWGWLVVLAEMVSVLVLPVLMLAALFGCILHLSTLRRIAERPEGARD